MFHAYKIFYTNFAWNSNKTKKKKKKYGKTERKKKEFLKWRYFFVTRNENYYCRGPYKQASNRPTNQQTSQAGRQAGRHLLLRKTKSNWLYVVACHHVRMHAHVHHVFFADFFSFFFCFFVLTLLLKCYMFCVSLIFFIFFFFENFESFFRKTTVFVCHSKNLCENINLVDLQSWVLCISYWIFQADFEIKF